MEIRYNKIQMSKVIILNKKGYDPFIDFIKAYAIICVLAGHTFPYRDETGYGLWYGMQVPLFVLVQVFHVFKKENPSFNFKKTMWRVFVPFIILQLGLFLLLLFHSNSLNFWIDQYIIGGGIGPGSYFPWVYLQLAILLPIVRPCFLKGGKIGKAIICIAICEGLEILTAMINMPDDIYRLLSIRYFFLIYLGWIWVKDGIVINKATICLSVASMISIVYFEYFYIPTEPWFYDTAWNFHRWPCYFYVSHLLCYMIYLIYQKVSDVPFVMKSVKFLAKCSYEIFLLQMVVLPFFPAMDFIENHFLRFGIRTTVVFIICIYGGWLFNGFYNKFMNHVHVNTQKV